MSRTPVRRCQECGSDKLIRDYENAEIVCANCGFVVQEKIADTGPEWRAFNDEQKAKRTRVGAPLTYTIHDKGLSTVIDWRRLPNTRHISPDQAAQIYNLRKWQRRVRLS
ncbi:transcription initiation factor IIB, partial [Candidatus Bathyarchaeota archaeon]|nr:transcription initiation factor IIB [Candidatus Bathyarchaeota archaeon]